MNEKKTYEDTECKTAEPRIRELTLEEIELISGGVRKSGGGGGFGPSGGLGGGFAV